MRRFGWLPVLAITSGLVACRSKDAPLAVADRATPSSSASSSSASIVASASLGVAPLASTPTGSLDALDASMA